MPEQLRRRLRTHHVGDLRAPVAALRDVPRRSRVARISWIQASAMWTGSQPVVVGLPGEAVSGHRRDHDVERVRGVAAVRGRVGERADDVQHLDDRARPAVRDDHRQRVLVRRPDVDEVDVEAVDLGQELREGVQPRLEPAEVVVVAPVAGELLHRRQLHALRRVGDGLLLGPARGRGSVGGGRRSPPAGPRPGRGGWPPRRWREGRFRRATSMTPCCPAMMPRRCQWSCAGLPLSSVDRVANGGGARARASVAASGRHESVTTLFLAHGFDGVHHFWCRAERLGHPIQRRGISQARRAGGRSEHVRRPIGARVSTAAPVPSCGRAPQRGLRSG